MNFLTTTEMEHRLFGQVSAHPIHCGKFYKHTVVDSKSLGSNGASDKYWMRVVNREVVAETGLDVEYETTYSTPMIGDATAPPMQGVYRRFVTLASLISKSSHRARAVATSVIFTVLPDSRRETAALCRTGSDCAEP